MVLAYSHYSHCKIAFSKFYSNSAELQVCNYYRCLIDSSNDPGFDVMVVHGDVRNVDFVDTGAIAIVKQVVCSPPAWQRLFCLFVIDYLQPRLHVIIQYTYHRS